MNTPNAPDQARLQPWLTANVPVSRVPVACSVAEAMCREKMGHGSDPHWCCLPKGHDGQHSCGVCAVLWDTPNAPAHAGTVTSSVKPVVGNSGISKKSLNILAADDYEEYGDDPV